MNMPLIQIISSQIKHNIIVNSMVYSKIIETNKINLSEASYDLYTITDQKTTNKEEGLNYIKKVMKEESPNAYYAYGFALVRGIGVPKDPNLQHFCPSCLLTWPYTSSKREIP